MKNKITKWLLSLVVFLLVASSATSIALASVLNQYNQNDKGAISIAPENWNDQTVLFPEEGNKPETENAAENMLSEKPLAGENSHIILGSERVPDKFGFIVSDDKTVWGTETNVDIFKVTYENGKGVVTAESFNGEKIVAPGTENSYTFKLKNNSLSYITYTLNVDAFITPGDEMIPIESRISRYDGKWIVGGEDSWVDVPTLDTAADEGALSPGRYTYYTLDWCWPFEGNDELDTYLGNLAEEEDITITIVISTTAVLHIDGEPEMEEGLIPPDTGDNSILSLWISLAVGAAIFLIIIIIYRIRDEKRSKTEASEN